MNDAPTSRRVLLFLRLIVYLAGTLVGGGFGGFAGSALGPKPTDLLGRGLGAINGLLAGLIWCWLILGSRALGRTRPRSLMICLLGGSGAGVLAGWTATVLLWVGLGLLSPLLVKPTMIGERIPYVVLVATFLGTWAGALTGLVCGSVSSLVLRKRLPPEL